MPITRDADGYLVWPDAWGTPSLGLETGRMEACVSEVLARGLHGAFGRRPEFREADLSCLSRLGHLTSLQLWDISLRDLDGIYGLQRLTHLRLSGKRPPVDLARLPGLRAISLEHRTKDSGLGVLARLHDLSLWRYKAPDPDRFDLPLPRGLKRFELLWSNVRSLDGFGPCPDVTHVTIARCRNLADLGPIAETFPKLEHLVVYACGRMAPEAAETSLRGHPAIRRAHVGGKLLVSTSAP